jgi:hypothetical protein
MALEATPTVIGFEIAKSLTPKRMSEYGANHKLYQSLLEELPQFTEPNMSDVL